MIEVKQQPLTEDLKLQIYKGFSRHTKIMVGHDEKYEPIAFIACDTECFVDAMSFPALNFYQKMGVELELTRSGYKHGTSLHYLRKILN